MESLGLLSFTSARTAHGKRRAFINYDDLYALELAERHGGCVLSGDHYTDILKLPQYRFGIEKSLVYACMTLQELPRDSA